MQNYIFLYISYLATRVTNTNTKSIIFSTTENSTIHAAQVRIAVVSVKIEARITEIQSMLSSITGSTISSSDLGVETVSVSSEVIHIPCKWY